MRARFAALAVLLALWFVALPHAAATFAVKQDGSGDYTSPVTCMNSVANGDMCQMQANTGGGTQTFSGGTITASGGVGALKYLVKRAGDTVTITTTLATGSTSYVQIGGDDATTGIAFTAPITFTGGTGKRIQYNTITGPMGDSVLCMGGSTGMLTHYMVIANNTITLCGTPGGNAIAAALQMGGDHALIEGNTISHVRDGIVIYGANHIIRNNHCGPIDPGEYGSNHPDCLESSATTEAPLIRTLFEGNTTCSWGGSDGHTHLLRDTLNQGMSGIILRFNYGCLIGSFYTTSDTFNRKLYIYNESVNVDGTTDRTDLAALTSAPSWFVKNNILKDLAGTSGGNPAAICADASSAPLTEAYNLFFLTGYSGSWDGPASCSTGAGDTYAASDIKNQDPLFISGTNLALQPGSPALHAGGPLTTANGAGTSSTTFITATGGAGFFSDGYGITGVLPDRICITTVTNCVDLVTVDVATETLTLASPMTWLSGANVWLKRKSDGADVLVGAAPNIGAWVEARRLTPFLRP